MGLLEKGLSWISLFIALAPMLGFMGTVIGMIGAFDSIEAAGDISPSLSSWRDQSSSFNNCIRTYCKL